MLPSMLGTPAMLGEAFTGHSKAASTKPAERSTTPPNPGALRSLRNGKARRNNTINATKANNHPKPTWEQVAEKENKSAHSGKENSTQMGLEKKPRN